MRRADLISQFVLENYIKPASTRGDNRITVRAGDVHREMGLQSAMPAVASALGADKFQEYAHVRLVARDGPHNGANLRLTYELL